MDVSARWWSRLDPEWEESRSQALRLLEEASEVEETARIIGEKALPDEQRLVLLLAEMLREGFLVQSAFHEVDTYCEAEKQTSLLKVLIEFYNKVDPLVRAGVPIEMIREMDIVTVLMRLKERAGVEPIEEASKAILAQRDVLAEEYEVKL
jgi:V/A-type H+-transporting ATPase subunit A